MAATAAAANTFRGSIEADGGGAELVGGGGTATAPSRNKW